MNLLHYSVNVVLYGTQFSGDIVTQIAPDANGAVFAKALHQAERSIDSLDHLAQGNLFRSPLKGVPPLNALYGTNDVDVGQLLKQLGQEIGR